MLLALNEKNHRILARQDFEEGFCRLCKQQVFREKQFWFHRGTKCGPPEDLEFLDWWKLDWLLRNSKIEEIQNNVIFDLVGKKNTLIKLQSNFLEAETIVQVESCTDDMVWLWDARRFSFESWGLQKDGRAKVVWKAPVENILICKRPVFLDIGAYIFQPERFFGYRKLWLSGRIWKKNDWANAFLSLRKPFEVNSEVFPVEVTFQRGRPHKLAPIENQWKGNDILIPEGFYKKIQSGGSKRERLHFPGNFFPEDSVLSSLFEGKHKPYVLIRGVGYEHEVVPTLLSWLFRQNSFVFTEDLTLVRQGFLGDFGELIKRPVRWKEALPQFPWGTTLFYPWVKVEELETKDSGYCNFETRFTPKLLNLLETNNIQLFVFDRQDFLRDIIENPKFWRAWFPTMAFE